MIGLRPSSAVISPNGLLPFSKSSQDPSFNLSAETDEAPERAKCFSTIPSLACLCLDVLKSVCSKYLAKPWPVYLIFKATLTLKLI